MIAWLAVWSALAHAEEFYLEAPPVATREDAVRVEEAVRAAGYPGRVVRRFRLGRGWEFVVLVEHFASDKEAAAAAARLGKELGSEVTAWRLDDAPRAVAVDLPPVASAPADTGAAEWIARARATHGGSTGGASGLARVAAVHFVFARTLVLDSKEVTIRHDYWREGASRRLAVQTGGAGQDSLAVATAGGAWLRAAGEVQVRDIGVTLGAVDAFAPEAVLTVALEAARLLDGPEVAGFQELEGAESGRRFGSGGDESEPGLSFVDLDPTSGQLLRVRYASEAGPITFEMSGWRQVRAGVLVPAEVRVERADGRVETLRIELLDLVERAPSGTFDRPT